MHHRVLDSSQNHPLNARQVVSYLRSGTLQWLKWFLGQLYAIYGSLFVTFALFLECISFITESAGFTYPLFLKLFRRYGILHFFAVIFVMISAGLWYGFSEHLMHNLDQYPKERGSKVPCLNSIWIFIVFVGDNWLFTCLLVHGYRGSRGSCWCRIECVEDLWRISWWRSTEAYSWRTQVRF